MKRKIEEREDSPVRPVKRLSMLDNTPQQWKEQRRKVLKISKDKLKAIRDVDCNLRISVLINNTYRKMKRELRENNCSTSWQYTPKPLFAKRTQSVLNYYNCEMEWDKSQHSSDKADSDMSDSELNNPTKITEQDVEIRPSKSPLDTYKHLAQEAPINLSVRKPDEDNHSDMAVDCCNVDNNTEQHSLTNTAVNEGDCQIDNTHDDDMGEDDKHKLTTSIEDFVIGKSITCVDKSNFVYSSIGSMLPLFDLTTFSNSDNSTCSSASSAMTCDQDSSCGQSGLVKDSSTETTTSMLPAEASVSNGNCDLDINQHIWACFQQFNMAIACS